MENTDITKQPWYAAKVYIYGSVIKEYPEEAARLFMHAGFQDELARWAGEKFAKREASQPTETRPVYETDVKAIEAALDTVVETNKETAERVKDKPSLLGWFVGQVMKATAGKQNPSVVQSIVKAKFGYGE